MSKVASLLNTIEQSDDAYDQGYYDAIGGKEMTFRANKDYVQGWTDGQIDKKSKKVDIRLAATKMKAQGWKK